MQKCQVKVGPPAGPFCGGAPAGPFRPAGTFWFTRHQRMTRKTARKRHKPSPPKTAAPPEGRPSRPRATTRRSPSQHSPRQAPRRWGFRSIPHGTPSVVRNLHLILAHAARVERIRRCPTISNPRRCSMLEAAGRSCLEHRRRYRRRGRRRAAPARTRIVEAALSRIRPAIPLLNAFTAVTEERALARAQAIDEALARGERLCRRWRACRSRSRTCSTLPA